MSGSAKRSRSKAESLADAAVEKHAKRRKSSTSKSETATETPLTEKYADIKSNPFYQAVVASDASPTEKKDAVAKLLAYEEEKSATENEAKLAAFETFKEYLMAYRKEMAKEIIRLQDTEAFSELQKVFEDMNSALLDFEDQIKPLVEIIDAVHRLNIASDGAMYDVFKEIQADKAEELRIAELRATQEAEKTKLERDILEKQKRIAELRTDTSWWTGKVTSKSQAAIAGIEVEINAQNEQVSNLTAAIDATVVNRESKFADLAYEKGKLRELLDLTSDEHVDRQEALVTAALNFVNVTEERSGSVLTHMVEMKERIRNVDTVNGNMKRIFAIVSDGIKDAEDVNEGLTTRFSASTGEESSIERLEREDRLQGVNEHVDSLNTSKLDTLETMGELQEESLNIKAMRDTNSSQINHTRKMHSRGTAGVASRLSTVLTAVSSAALNEARITTQNTLESMNDMTRETAQSEAIKNATRLHTENDQLTKAIEQLAAYRDISDKATEISRAALEEQKVLQREMEQTAEELAESIKDAKSVTSRVMQGDDGEEEVREERASSSDDKSSPFGGLGSL